MVRKQTNLLVVLLLFIFSAGTLLGADLLVKKPLKITGDEIPVVVSSREALNSASRLSQSPGTVLDSTYYDWQRNGGLDDHLAFFDQQGTVKINGTMMVAYQQSTADRTMRYYFWDGTGWSGHGLPVYPARNGFGSLTQFANGSVVIAAHTDPDFVGLRCHDARDAAPGSRIFSYCDTDTVSDGSFQIWPRITTTSNGSVVITGTNQATLNGITTPVAWARAVSPDSCFRPWNLISDISPDWMDNDMEWPTIAAGSSGRVGIVIPDVAGAIRYYSSTDNGDSFTENIIAAADTAGLPAGLDSTAARLGWINSDIMYIGTEPHVVWSAGQGLNTGGGTYGIADFKSTIYHWSPSTGIDTVAVAWTQSAETTRSDYLQTPYNHLSVDWPSIGLAVDGQRLVVAFVGFSTNDIDPNSSGPAGPGVGYCDIYMAWSSDNGNTWTPPIPVTNPDGTNLGWDDRYPSIAKVNMDNNADPGKDVYMIYQTDDEGGTFVQGTEAVTNMDYVKFLGVDLPELILQYPDPGQAGQVNDFVVTGATPGDLVYYIYSFQPGSTNVPGCPGETVDMNNPNIAGAAVADANGTATFSSFVPSPASNFTIRIQAVDLAACSVSNLLAYRFR